MKWFGLLIWSLLIVIFGGNCVMAKNTTTWPASAFLVRWGGDMQYGSREVFFDGKNKFYFALGDTEGQENRTGVGVFELDLKNADLAEMKAAGALFCDKDVPDGKVDLSQPQVTFQAACQEGREVIEKYSSLKFIPDRLQDQLYSTVTKFQNRAWVEGAKLIKLDFYTEKVEHKDGAFIVSVRFKNSGRKEIKFKTPDQWTGNQVGGQLGVGSRTKIMGSNREKLADAWAFDLAGKKNT